MLPCLVGRGATFEPPDPMTWPVRGLTENIAETVKLKNFDFFNVKVNLNYQNL